MARRSPQDAIRQAQEFNIDGVLERYAETRALPISDVRERARELKRFLALSALDSGSMGMSGPIDDLWHEFILHTKLYSEFCDAVAGCYIHHTPSSPGNGAQSDSNYSKFFAIYSTTFNEIPPERLWPRPNGNNCEANGWIGDLIKKVLVQAGSCQGGTTTTSSPPPPPTSTTDKAACDADKVGGAGSGGG